ncbi:MAG: DUF6261 family protein [Capnocytophaga sp.]|nr:DUF6261 family protein [Capnocytophaga sp.]
MIKRTNLNGVRQMEYYQVMATIKKFLEEENLENLGLNTIKEEFDVAFMNLDNSLKNIKKSNYTQNLVELSKKRDAYLVGLITQCNLYKNYPIENVAQSAKKIIPIIDKYGKKPQNKPMQEKTGIIVNLLDDFDANETKKDIELLHIKEWITALKEVNNNFLTIYEERIKEKSTIKVGSAKEMREIMHKTFVKLCKAIDAFSFVRGEKEYEHLSNNINETVRKALT